MRHLAAPAGLLFSIAVACGGGDEKDGATAQGGGAPTSGTTPYCVDGKPAPYPADAALAASKLPDLTFDGDGAAVRVRDFFEPCAARARLLIVRTSAAWCGTCRWHAEHTGELRALDSGDRLAFLDLVVAGDDNLPATPRDAAAWRARIDQPGVVAADPTFQLAPLNHGERTPLPLIALVDTRTMDIREVLHDPAPDLLAARVRAVLAALDGAPPPDAAAAPADSLQDARFSREQWDMIRAMRLDALGAPPPDPTNAKADDATAAALGARLFADEALTASQVSCSSCHRPAQHFVDGAPQSHDGVALVDRNAPSLLLASYGRWQFWDGRADSLWMQALGPPENAREMASTRLHIAHQIFDRYRADYEAVFGPMPPLDDAARFPAEGKPGDAAWTAMAPADQTAATRVFVGYGKAIAAYERTLRVAPSTLDAYANGDASALEEAAKDGLLAFFRVGCAQCHYGPRLTDDAFHVIRLPTGRQDKAADPGRVDGVPQLLASEFIETGAFSDAPADTHGLAGLAPPPPSMVGAFKTPPLRGVAQTAPYGHGGAITTIAEMTAALSTAGLDPSSALATGTTEPWVTPFDDATRDALTTFLRGLTADPAAAK